MNLRCLDDLLEFLKKSHAAASNTVCEVPWEACPENVAGDITINCFRIARFFGMSPDSLATETADFLSKHGDVEAVEKLKAFVNVTLKPTAIYAASVADVKQLLSDAGLPADQRRKILVEYSAPNTNKPQHLGHVRNNTIGMSLVSILSRAGHDVVPVNLVNDRGIHICKSMLAYQRCGNGVTPESAGIKGDHLVGDFYVKYNSLLSDELKALKAEKPELAEKSNEELFLDTEIGAAAQSMLQKWEAGDDQVRALWNLMNGWVFKGFAETYERMGVHFDKTYLESETYLLGKEVVAKGLEKGIFKKREDGAVIIDLGKLGTKVLLRKDGTSVYITQDLGTTLLKHANHTPDSMIWVVGDEQILHFKMLFAILKLLGYSWADNLYHLSYGMVNLPTGKMKSREGTVVDADDLFDEMHDLAKAATLERLGENQEPPADLEERSEIIGMGALKFMLLKFNPKTTMMFDPQASLKFEGDTGPYVQYVCVRINSIMAKVAERGIVKEDTPVDWSLLDSEVEKSLAITTMRYRAALLGAAEKMDSSVLVLYLLDLAKAFNRFYREKQVLNVEDPVLGKTRLALCEAVREVLVDGLKTLTIGVPQAM